MRVPIASLREAHSPRIDGEDPDHVRALAETTEKLPPIVVHKPTMRIIDGMHRLRAAQLCGHEEIEARFFGGTEDEAFLLAVRANIVHGLPLSLADRKTAAANLLAANPQWSDRMIASKTGLAAKTVGALRGYASGEGSSRIGRDGRVRPVSANEGRQIASELFSRDPALSLRKVARAAGISPETARDVRRRLDRGEDTVTPQSATPPSAPQPRSPSPAEAEDPGPSLQSALYRLRTDPSLRLTESGRALLQILGANSSLNGPRLQSILDNVPEHCRDIVAKAAKECAQVWHSVAGRLDP
ncbi:ParB-like chromosome segregation protein Spo0J [Kibdelosporangium banguiense]|uniref:ParB-like chromosome segregation protein Spo0J n=1 Tax=Kibdelosporangium banguiense TaxID=1365924 RepID=A0ABS4TKR0_9PSEU|nr:ParB/RepB/Spo0J family partition protein [Kibdelosporangium banguiense]MBP2325000.1 ParB-like chromosome segregation protein Spo0J [Kibdelosporangium banguiense]